MNILKKVTSLATLLLLGLTVCAQQAAGQVNEDTDFMNSNGKIYVVVAVIVVIMIALFLYLFSLDKKISKMEKDQHQQ